MASELKNISQIANYEHYTDSVAVQFTVDQTEAMNTTIITPASGKRLRIHDVYCNIGNTSGTVILEYANSGYEFYRFESTASSSRDHVNLREVGAVNEAIRVISTQGSNNLNLSINFTEVTDVAVSTGTSTSTSTSSTTSSTTTS
ncbi:MAG: hypothetical protein QQN63_08960 [Nitrosopumilus sp.]